MANWYIYKSYIAQNEEPPLFQARVSDGKSIIIDIDECNFTNMFEAIAYGEYKMRSISEEAYAEWMQNPIADMPATEITFDGSPYENIKKYFEMESNCASRLSTFEKEEYNNIIYIRFVASSLVLDDEGTDPQSEISAMSIVDSLRHVIDTQAGNGKAMYNRKAASLGYEIKTNTPNDHCVAFLNKFFTALYSQDSINRADYNELEQEMLQQIASSFAEFKNIKGLKQFEVTIGDGEPLLIPLEHLFEPKYSPYKKEVELIGTPDRINREGNSFWLRTDCGSYACHLSVNDRTTLDNVQTAYLRKAKIQVRGEIDYTKSSKVKTVDVKYMEFDG